MSLPWVRLDSQFPSNPKVLALVDDKAWQALSVYVCGLAYAGAHGTDGFIPRAALRFIHARPRDAEKLVEVGLWNECAGGWDIQSWADYQPSVEEFQKRKERAKYAAAVRWSKAEAGKPIADATSNAPGIASSNAERTDGRTDIRAVVNLGESRSLSDARETTA